MLHAINSNAFLLNFTQSLVENSTPMKVNELSGTGTFTKAKEGSDQDKHSFSASYMGTQTLTEVKREGRDQDRSQVGFHLIPRS